MIQYGLMLLNGDGIPVDKKIGMNYIKKAVDLESTDALYIYASMLENGREIKCNKKSAAEYYKKAEDKRNPDAAFS